MGEIDVKKAKLNKNRKFAESNEFITAVFDRRLSVLGQKLIRLAIAECDSSNDKQFYRYEVKVLDLAKLLEIKDTNHIYEDIKKALRFMSTMAVGVENKKKNGSFAYYPMFRALKYHDNSGYIEVEFNEEMTPFFLQLKGNFTQIPLEQIIFMTHKYSIRIYELIKMKLRNEKVYADKCQRIELTVEEIRKATNTEKSFKQIGELKKRVIVPSIEDIEKNAYYHCEFRDIKDGRRIVGFEVNVWSVIGWNYVQLQKGQLDGQMSLLDFFPEDRL